MNYLFIMLMAVLSIIFAILSSFSKDDNLNSIFKWGAGFSFVITGLLIYMYGIDIPIGTLTELVR